MTAELITLGGDDPVSGLLDRGTEARALYVFGHGAGAGMRHAFMEAMSTRLVARGIATLRYHFPYMEHGSRRPDRADRLVATVRAAIDAGAEHAPGLPLFAGGKSMGGRMTSQALAGAPDARVGGVAFLGFPLHPARRPGTDRAAHLADVSIPMLFVQGTRDDLADLDLLRPIVAGLGDRATMHVVDGADHGFGVLKRSGRTPDDTRDEAADALANWIADRIA